MERRKLTTLDDYIISIDEPPELVNRRIQFYNDLRHFYRRKWGCPFKVPFIHGVEVDLHRLYEAVIGLGGWQKVSNTERWTEVLREIGFDEDIQMVEYGVKMLYMRYLSKFEQAEFGNENDDHENELLSSRSSRLKNFALVAHSECPVSMTRPSYCDGSGPDYQKLYFSLMSGLPNEVDFALNVCTLISHPGPYLLQLNKCPALLTLFAAHCGVFDDGMKSLSDLHLNAWREHSGHDFYTFWRRAGILDAEIRALIPHVFCEKTKAKLPKNDETGDNNDKAEDGVIRPQKRLSSRYARLFCSNHDGSGDEYYDLKNVVNWRVFQILSICRNLSFEECNRSAMAANLPLLKFLIVCCYSQHQILVNSAFDTLSNIAMEIDLSAGGSVFEDYLLLKTVSRGLFSPDKFEILRSLEIFAGLCHKRNNETLLCDFISEKILSRIFDLLTAKDISLCIFTLESLYQMSEMGRSCCEIISRHDRGVDLLVNLATTDAASFGASGLAGIKVVAIHGLTGQLQPYMPNRSTAQSLQNVITEKPVAPVTVNNNSLSTRLFSSPATSMQKPQQHHGQEQHQQQHGALFNHAYHHFQNYVPPPPSPLATVTTALSQHRPSTSQMTPAYSSSIALPASLPPAPHAQVFQYMPATTPVNAELSIKTGPISTSIKTPSALNGSTFQIPQTPQVSLSQLPASPVVSSVVAEMVTPPSSRGKRLTSGVRGSLMRSKAATKAASMRAVQEVVAAMSSSANRKPATDEPGILDEFGIATTRISPTFSGSANLACGTGESRLEQLTKAWINEHCVMSEGAVANRGELYAAYVEHVQSTKNASGGTQMLAGGMSMFINQLKALFPNIQITHSPGSTIHAVEGIYFAKDGKLNDFGLPAKHSAATHASSNLLQVASDSTYKSSAGLDVKSNDLSANFLTDGVEKKLLLNGFIHSGDSLEKSLQNGSVIKDEKFKLNSFKQQNVTSNINNNNSKTEEESWDPLSNKYGGFDGSSNVNNHNSNNNTDSNKCQTSEDDLVKSAEDNVSTIGAFLKATASPALPNGQSFPTSAGRGKRRTQTNGHSRGFSKKAKTAVMQDGIGINGAANGAPAKVSTTMISGATTAISGNAVVDIVMPSTSAAVQAPVDAHTSATATIVAATPVVVSVAEYMCEWDCCGRLFASAGAMLYHSAADHLTDPASSDAAAASTSLYNSVQERFGRPTNEPRFVCRWPSCDSTPRSKWSIATHLQDHHCTEQVLQAALRKRIDMGHENYIAWVRQRIAKLPTENSIEVSLPYTAADAIKRHVPHFVGKEITDDNEGPVTRSLRLTSCLVLRNLTKHSVEGRRKMRKHESHLSWLALSKMESNVALAQTLGELSAHSIAATASSAANGVKMFGLGEWGGCTSASEADDSQPSTPCTPL